MTFKPPLATSAYTVPLFKASSVKPLARSTSTYSESSRGQDESTDPKLGLIPDVELTSQKGRDHLVVESPISDSVQHQEKPSTKQFLPDVRHDRGFMKASESFEEQTSRKKVHNNTVLL